MINASENKKVVEIHGCIVCAKIYNVLVLYTPDGKVRDSTVTSPGGHIVSNERRPLVACDRHTKVEIESAKNKRLSSKSKESDYEEEED